MIASSRAGDRHEHGAPAGASREFEDRGSSEVMNDHPAQTVPVVVVLPAEIDVTNADEVHQQLIAALSPGVATVIADLTSTSFCDSSGVHAIVHANERASAREIGLRLAVSPDGSVRRVLQLTGADHIMPVFASVQEAIQGVQPVRRSTITATSSSLEPNRASAVSMAAVRSARCLARE
jgi:anti-sigma B factor antagonist